MALTTLRRSPMQGETRRPALSRRAVAWLIVLLGVVLVAAAAAMVFPPAGLFVLGVGVIVIGLLAFDIGAGDAS